jgi:hypothetical protein
VTFHLNIATCARCPNQQRPCAGACACKIDGADITQHARENVCPEGRYGKEGMLTPEIWESREPSLESKLLGEVEAADAEGRALGETAHAILAAMGAERAAALWTYLTGKSCGCEERRERLNRRFPRGLWAWASERLHRS